MTRTDAKPEAPGRRWPLLGAGIACLLLLLGALAWAKSLRDLRSARAREAMLEAKISDKDQRIDSLRTRIQGLRDDPALLERLAREELGLVRPKDIVIELPVEPAATPQGPQGAQGSAPAGAWLDPAPAAKVDRPAPAGRSRTGSAVPPLPSGAPTVVVPAPE